MKRLTKKQVNEIQKIGEAHKIDNLGSTIKSVTDYMATPSNKLSHLDKMVLEQICPECRGKTITISCKKIKELKKCKIQKPEIQKK